MESSFPVDGGCDCGKIRYRMLTRPLIVHCCHCRWCQRETGASFALNAMIEADRVTVRREEPEMVRTPSSSGVGQRIVRCPDCKIAVWSHYDGSGHLTKFVRVGSLDEPDVLPPDVHIFTASKQPWLVLPGDAQSYSEFYERDDVWSRDSIDRFEALQPQIEAYRASLQKP